MSLAIRQGSRPLRPYIALRSQLQHRQPCVVLAQLSHWTWTVGVWPESRFFGVAGV